MLLCFGVYNTNNNNLRQVWSILRVKHLMSICGVQVVMSTLADLIGSLRAQRGDEPGIDANRTGRAHPG